jgi:hypothetical protein
MAFAMHSRLSLPMAEHRLPERVAMEEMTAAAPVKMAANDATAEKTPLNTTTAAGSLENVDEAQTKYVVAVLAEPSQPTTDPKVSATTTLPGRPADDVRYAADTLENVAMLSRGSGMAY